MVSRPHGKKNRYLEGASSNVLGRWLHFGIALCLVLVLLLSLVMTTQATIGITVGLVAFTLHKFIGLNLLLFISLYFLWMKHGHTKKFTDLYPWFSRHKLIMLFEEIMLGWRHYKEWRLIPAAVQGVGLLIVLLTTLVGLILLIDVIFPSVLARLGMLSTMKEAHHVLTWGIWGYLLIHVGAFFLHLFIGNRKYLQMFQLLTLDARIKPRDKFFMMKEGFHHGSDLPQKKGVANEHGYKS